MSSNNAHGFSATAVKKYEPIARILARYRGRITELSINGPEDAWVRIAGEGYKQVEPALRKGLTQGYIEDLCRILAAQRGIRFSTRLPLLACRTPDGCRFQAMVGEANVKSGLSVSIRVPRIQNVEWDSFHVREEWRDEIAAAVSDGRAVLISGGTSSGKTTFQNFIAKFIPAEDRIVTIEDVEEMRITHTAQRVTQLFVTRTESVSELNWPHMIDHCLRINPDDILPGELSIPSAFPTLQAMDTGHDSVITTMHSNTPRDAVRGFARRVALGGGSETVVRSVEEFIADTVGLIVQIKHQRHGADKERRVVTDVVRPKDLWQAGDGLVDVAGALRAVEGSEADVLSSEETRILSPEEQSMLAAHRLGHLDPRAARAQGLAAV